MKSKKLLWIIGLFLVISSVVVQGAIGDVFRNMSSSIRGFTSGISLIPFIVNTVLIALFIFIVVHFLPENYGGKLFKPQTKTGKVIFFIPLILLSVFFANRVATATGNKYIWHEEAVVLPAFRYLFSTSDPLGIFMPSRILIFLGAAFLLSWLFTTIVKIGQGKSKIDITIAVILAAEMAHQGLSKNSLVALGQIISVGLLYRQFKRKEETKFDYSAIVWSLGLVLWISAIAFPDDGVLSSFTWIVSSLGYFNYLLLF